MKSLAEMRIKIAISFDIRREIHLLVLLVCEKIISKIFVL